VIYNEDQVKVCVFLDVPASDIAAIALKKLNLGEIEAKL
jgi:hypothetical protein